MNGPRAQNPFAAAGSTSGSKTAASADKTAVASKGAGEGTTNDKYLQETREQNPDPNEEQKDKAKVCLAKCQFATPKEELKLNEPFEFSVEVKKIGEAKSMSPAFDLYCTRTREGKEERDKIWGGKEGKPVDAKADPVVVKGKDVLATQADYVLGEKVVFELEATHQEADEPAKSDKVDVSLKTVAHWVGGDDLFFRTDGEFPLLGAEGSLVGVLVAAVDRVKKPAQVGETAICFGFASSAGEADANRSLSLRRTRAVKALLDRDEPAWVELAKANFETSDIQQFLSDLHAACGWECDPGAVDGKAGPKTKTAIESFQAECNARYNLGLKPDGVCGPKTWAAVHRAILGQVQAAMDEDAAKAPAWPKPNWGNKGEGVHANGEDFATGGDKPEERSVQITFFAPGSEPPLKEVASGQKVTPEHNPVQQPDRVEKVKVEKGGGNRSTPVKDDEKDVIYCAATDSLAILSKEQKASLAIDEEINKAFKPWLAFVLSHQDNKAKDGDRMTDDEIAARVQAVYVCLTTVSGIKEDQKARTYVSHLAGNISDVEKRILADIKAQKGSLTAGHKMESGKVKEILRVGNKRAVWARNAYWDEGVKWQPRDQIIRQIREERTKAKQEEKASKGPEKELEIKLFEEKLFDPIDNSLIPAVDKFFQDHCVNLLHGSKNFDASLSASVFRYTAESAFGATMNWKEQRTIKIGVKAEGSFSIAQASGTTSVHFPSKDGGDLLGILRAVSPSLVKSSAEPLPFKLVLEIKGSAFVGACASASLEGGVSLKQNPDGGLNAGVDLFAGAKASAEASLATMVRLLSDEDRKKGLKPNQVDWAELTKATFGVWAAAGFGLEAAFKLGFFEKKWVYQVKAGIVVKGGCGAHVKGSVDAQLMAKMAFHMANAVDWKGVGDLFDQAATVAFEAILYQCFTTGQTIRQAAREVSDLNDQALSNIVHTASRSLNELKRVDDYLDHAIPGYSGYKKFQAPFLLLKGARTWAQGLSTEMSAKERAIYTVENANKNHLWQYATWKTKANLIFEMKLGGAGLLGFGEERKEEAIIAVLNGIRHRDEFKKIQDNLKDRGVAIDDLVDGVEQDRLDAIRRRFGL